MEQLLLEGRICHAGVSLHTKHGAWKYPVYANKAKSLVLLTEEEHKNEKTQVHLAVIPWIRGSEASLIFINLKRKIHQDGIFQ